MSAGRGSADHPAAVRKTVSGRYDVATRMASQRVAANPVIPDDDLAAERRPISEGIIRVLAQKRQGLKLNSLPEEVDGLLEQERRHH